MQKTRSHNLVAMFVLACALAPLRGECRPSCFVMAENYYEQIYCEIQASGRGDELPVFGDFRENDSVTQALLLKRPAARLGIEVVQPVVPDHAQTPARTPVTQAAAAVSGTAVSGAAVPGAAGQRVHVSTELTGCQLRGAMIHCATGHYQLTGNRGNRHLAPGVLDASNQLNLGRPSTALGVGGTDGAYDGTYEGAALRRYLTDSYTQYLHKMLAIGLGAVTLSYHKFQFIYADVTARGADFSARFETMYGFLKQDKQNMDAGGGLPSIGDLHMAACELFAGGIIACDGGGRNFLFVKVHSATASESLSALPTPPGTSPTQ